MVTVAPSARSPRPQMRSRTAASGAGGGRWYRRAMTDLPPDFFNRPLAEVDPDIAQVLEDELHRQQRTLEMIA